MIGQYNRLPCVVCFLSILGLSACDSSSLQTTGFATAETIPVEADTTDANTIAEADIAAAAAATADTTPTSPAAASPASLINGDFESGINGWNSCGNIAGATSTSVMATGGVLNLGKDGCVYQNQPIQASEDVQVSCQIRKNGNGWAALQLAYLGRGYQPLASEEVEITSPTLYEISIPLMSTPNTAFVEVLAYTTGEAELVIDNCALAPLGDVNPTNPTLPSVISNPLDTLLPPSIAHVMSMQSFGTDPNDINAAGQIDWAAAWIAHDNEHLWLAWDLHESIPGDTWGLGIHIDSDRDPQTGFRGFNNEYPIGVDYLVEGEEQFTYTGSGNDWSWEYVSNETANASATASMVKVSIAHLSDNDVAEFDVFFLGNNESLFGETHDYYPDQALDVNDDDSTGRFFTYTISTTQPSEPPGSCDLFVSHVPESPLNTRSQPMHFVAAQDNTLYYRDNYDQIWNYNPDSSDLPQQLFAGTEASNAIKIFYADESSVYFTDSACSRCDAIMTRLDKATNTVEPVPIDTSVGFYEPGTVYGDTVYYRDSDPEITGSAVWAWDEENGKRQLTQGISVYPENVVLNGGYLYFIAQTDFRPDRVYQLDLTTGVASLLYTSDVSIYDLRPTDDGGAIVQGSRGSFVRFDTSGATSFYDLGLLVSQYEVVGDDVFVYTALDGMAELHRVTSNGITELLGSVEGGYVPASSRLQQIGSDFYIGAAKSRTDYRILRFGQYGGSEEVTEFNELSFPNPTTETPFELVAIDDALYFPAYKDGAVELWSYHPGCE